MQHLQSRQTPQRRLLSSSYPAPKNKIIIRDRSTDTMNNNYDKEK